MLNFNAILEKRSWTPPLRYGISDRQSFPTLDPLHYLELIFQSSAHIIQWREKDLSCRENRKFVVRGVQCARQSGKLFLVNSSAELGLTEGADGVHLTSSQAVSTVLEARRAAGRLDFMVGQSVHSLPRAVEAVRQGVDYLLLGPIFDPLSKEPGRSPLGLSSLQEAVQTLCTPIFALGGMDETNFEAVTNSGVSGMAGITWLKREVRALL